MLLLRLIPLLLCIIIKILDILLIHLHVLFVTVVIIRFTEVQRWLWPWLWKFTKIKFQIFPKKQQKNCLTGALALLRAGVLRTPMALFTGRINLSIETCETGVLTLSPNMFIFLMLSGWKVTLCSLADLVDELRRAWLTACGCFVGVKIATIFCLLIRQVGVLTRLAEYTLR